MLVNVFCGNTSRRTKEVLKDFSNKWQKRLNGDNRSLSFLDNLRNLNMIIDNSSDEFVVKAFEGSH